MMPEYQAGRGTPRESLRHLDLLFKAGPGGEPVVEKPGADSLAATLAPLLRFDGAHTHITGKFPQSLNRQITRR